MDKIKILSLSLFLTITLTMTTHAEETESQIQSVTPVLQPSIIEKNLPVEEVTSSIELKVENNSVFLKAKGANLQALLKRLGEQAGFEVSIGPSSTTLSTSIEGLSVEDTIHRIMGIIQEKNYSIYYNEKGAIKKLEVLRETDTVPRPPAIIPAQRPSHPPRFQRFQRPQIPRIQPAQLPSLPEGMQEPPVPDEAED